MRIAVRCRVCGHITWIEWSKFKGIPTTEKLEHVVKQMRCSKCKRRYGSPIVKQVWFTGNPEERGSVRDIRLVTLSFTTPPTLNLNTVGKSSIVREAITTFLEEASKLDKEAILARLAEKIGTVNLLKTLNPPKEWRALKHTIKIPRETVKEIETLAQKLGVPKSRIPTLALLYTKIIQNTLQDGSHHIQPEVKKR